MFLAGTTVAIVCLSVAVALLASFTIARWLFRKDEEAEDRRRAAIRVSNTLTAMGLKRLPRILEAYAVYDWSGMAHEIKQFAELALDEKAIVTEFEQVFKGVLVKKLATEDGRAMIAALLADATQPEDPSITTAVKATATAA